MNVNIEVSPAYRPPYAVIYTDEVTDDIRRVMDVLGEMDTAGTEIAPGRVDMPGAADIRENVDTLETVDTVGKADMPAKPDAPVTAQAGGRTVILRPTEIYMVRVEGGRTVIYDKKASYDSAKRLYEIGDRLGAGFMQISKSTLVNLSQLSGVEAGFNGTLLLHLKNGLKDYVSRKYLPAFKKYLGL